MWHCREEHMLKRKEFSDGMQEFFFFEGLSFGSHNIYTKFVHVFCSYHTWTLTSIDFAFFFYLVASLLLGTSTNLWNFEVEFSC